MRHQSPPNRTALFALLALLGGCTVYEPTQAVPCVDGTASGFGCRNIDLAAHLPLATLGGVKTNDVWGWTDPETGAELALAGMTSGLTVVDATAPTAPVVLGFLPSASGTDQWRDIQTVQGHAYVVSEAAGHGMQILALAPLLGEPKGGLTEDGHYDGFDSAHNIASIPDRQLAWALGSDTCDGGLHGMDLSNPLHPTFLGCWDEGGYVHDAHCVTYQGPDADHLGEDICIALAPESEGPVAIIDMSDPAHPRTIATASYPNSPYAHQGWLTEDHAFFVMNDEEDEIGGTSTRTLFFDVRDLDAPRFVGDHLQDARSIGHDGYVAGDRLFETNLSRGLRVFDLVDPGSADMEEVAFFDTYPAGDGVSFQGAWGSYPFFPSGTVAVTSLREGLFLLNPTVP
jgi:choice-of-anchor B domain-containing protein